MKEIKTRIKSVESTKQITKAMELVSSSKFRKAKEKAESSRPYFNTLYNTVQDIAKNTSNSKNVFLKEIYLMVKFTQHQLKTVLMDISLTTFLHFKTKLFITMFILSLKTDKLFMPLATIQKSLIKH